jgi:hypothetical protein
MVTEEHQVIGNLLTFMHVKGLTSGGNGQRTGNIAKFLVSDKGWVGVIANIDLSILEGAADILISKKSLGRPKCSIMKLPSLD